MKLANVDACQPADSLYLTVNDDVCSSEIGVRRLHRVPLQDTAEKQGQSAIGTRRALNYLTLSVVPPAVSTWGGRRNSASRTSDSLSPNQAANIIAAAEFAVAIGFPFNRHVTIHWEQAGVPDERAAWATGRFIKLASDWIKKRGGQIAWVWVRENGDSKGSHVHILLHLPPEMSFGHMQRGWLRMITRRPYRASTIKTVRIGGVVRAPEIAPAAYWANLGAVVQYILKGASPAAAQSLGLSRLEAGGRIIGKRAATSQNIGAAVRARHGPGCVTNSPGRAHVM